MLIRSLILVAVVFTPVPALAQHHDGGMGGHEHHQGGGSPQFHHEGGGPGSDRGGYNNHRGHLQFIIPGSGYGYCDDPALIGTPYWLQYCL